MQQPTNNKSDALHGEGRETGGERNNQNQMGTDSDLGRKLWSTPELFVTM